MTLFPQKPDFKQLESSHEHYNLFPEGLLSAGCDTNPSKQHSIARVCTFRVWILAAGKEEGKTGKALGPLVGGNVSFK